MKGSQPFPGLHSFAWSLGETTTLEICNAGLESGSPTWMIRVSGFVMLLFFFCQGLDFVFGSSSFCLEVLLVVIFGARSCQKITSSIMNCFETMFIKSF